MMSAVKASSFGLVGMNKRSVERWLAAGGEPEYCRRRSTTNLIEPFRPYLEQRWQDGCQTNPQLLKELVERGFTGSLATVSRWTARRRAERPLSAAETEARVARWQALSRRRCAWLLSCDPATLENDEAAFLLHLFEIEPTLAEAAALGRQFAGMIRNGRHEELDGWLADAVSSALGAFATGIGRDRDAVRASMTHPWSTSPVEGQINRLKMIKRAMYGERITHSCGIACSPPHERERTHCSTAPRCTKTAEDPLIVAGFLS
ncbi:transposase [Hyphomicrobium sp.]|uniref:transposase n=1 Tax=Hyphomicrobium sp. TaxID=82 RepID=UPI003FA57E62